ncbi:putative Mg2+ transporter-C (MgtC) family protein [Fulvimarina manganoxydans]|uniref:Protein MgtC n=1 Tax=Fulvimarina manganoxydans TaxID=937218 RepID=A0A1W2DR45_9HYPH|nr:MgtC/SapB family protein [Fulvimarina manganoxydans]MCK5932511.1 MgtC/SapB family protein [Fulvimarina manganoxydans]MEE2953124.1 MgtC/SapB family protein [Pseudomonadota bacterium]SMC99921.1 putative Mg2+ transporter-C (MgtC) family protein [Fulvimarina manganoxydans]
MESFLDTLVSPMLMEQTGQLVVAALLAGVVGYERERKEQEAGLRTHMLVGIGACLFTLLMTLLIDRFETDDIRADPIRVVEAITSGIAFLAAGAIIQARGEVKGLTTGATLWVAGALGLAAGLGEYGLGVVAVLLTLVILRILKLLE